MLKGNLVGIRPIVSDDLDFLADLDVHPEVRANVVGWDWPVSRDARADWHKASHGDPRTRRLTVTELESGVPIGLTGLWEIDWHNRSALTAVKLMPGRAPRGAGSDAIMLMMAWSFYEVGLRRLHGAILEFNAASQGAYVRRCGWRIEGREREAVFRNGGWHDVLRVAILRREFDELTNADAYVRRVCPVDTGLTAADPVAATPGP